MNYAETEIKEKLSSCWFIWCGSWFVLVGDTPDFGTEGRSSILG